MSDRICGREGCGTPLKQHQRSYCSLSCSAVKGRCPSAGHTPEWPPERVMRLMNLWNEGLSTADIGLRLGITKNAVVGKAHRLHLPPRPSPIKPNSGLSYREQRGARPKRLPNGLLPAGIPTLPILRSLARKAPPSAPTRHTPSIVPPATERPIRVPQPRPERLKGRVEPCCFPIGDPGTRGFRFCDDPSEPGRPYCAAHMKVAYIRTPRISMAGLVA